MSTTQSESFIKRRTSERRRLKLLKNANQYKIPNPYKYDRIQAAFPDQLLKQLCRVDFLSETSISMLTLQKENTPNFSSQKNLQKMISAFRHQQQKFQCLFGSSEFCHTTNYQEIDSQLFSEDLKKDRSLTEQLIATKQQISINLYEPLYQINYNIFDCRLMDEDEMLNPEYSVQERIDHERQHELVLNQDYEDYFAS